MFCPVTFDPVAPTQAEDTFIRFAKKSLYSGESRGSQINMTDGELTEINSCLRPPLSVLSDNLRTNITLFAATGQGSTSSITHCIHKYYLPEVTHQRSEIGNDWKY